MFNANQTALSMKFDFYEEVRGTPLVEKKNFSFPEEWVFRDANQVDVVKNIQGIKINHSRCA